MAAFRNRVRCVALAALIGAAGCNATPVAKPSVKPAGASAKPTKKPTGAPSASATGKPATEAPAPAGGTRLQRPPGAGVALAGKVLIDAAYALGLGGAIISDNGGSIVSDNGGGVLGNNGASIAMGGAKLVGGQLVSNNGGAVALPGGGNLVAPGDPGAVGELPGGLLLANNGAGIVSDNGGGLVSNNGGAYRLLQAAGPRPGVVAPAAGMLVSVVSLRQRKYLPVGVDAAGKAVYGVYTNAAGGYEVFLPAGEAGNVLVVANPPGQPDPRLALNVVQPAAAASDQPLDELTAMTSRYIRRGIVGRMGDTLVNPAFTTEMLRVEPTTSAGGKAVLTQLFQALGEGAARAGLDAGTDKAIVEKRAQRIVDIGLADQDLGAIMMDGDAIAGWQGPPRPALAALRQRTKELLDGTADRLAADPAYFAAPFLDGVMNAPFQPGWEVVPLTASYEIRKPSDFTEFMLAEYFGVVRIGAETAFQRSFRVAFGVAKPRDPDPDPAVEARVQAANTELRGAIAAVFVALARRLVADPALADRIEATLKEPLP